MIQQLSDAELEIMKIVWGNPEEVTLFPYIMDGLAAIFRATFIVARFLSPAAFSVLHIPRLPANHLKSN